MDAETKVLVDDFEATFQDPDERKEAIVCLLTTVMHVTHNDGTSFDELLNAADILYGEDIESVNEAA